MSGSTRALPPIPDLSKYGDTTGTSLTATQYTDIYKDWVRLVKQQLDRRRVNLPPGAFDPEGREIMRFCIISGLTLAKTPREAVRAVALAVQKISLTAHWWTRFKFVSDAEMQEFKNIVWYSGPDDEGFCWLNVDAGKAVQRTGADAQRAAMAIQTAVRRGVPGGRSAFQGGGKFASLSRSLWSATTTASALPLARCQRHV